MHLDKNKVFCYLPSVKNTDGGNFMNIRAVFYPFQIPNVPVNAIEHTRTITTKEGVQETLYSVPLSLSQTIVKIAILSLFLFASLGFAYILSSTFRTHVEEVFYCRTPVFPEPTASISIAKQPTAAAPATPANPLPSSPETPRRNSLHTPERALTRSQLELDRSSSAVKLTKAEVSMSRVGIRRTTALVLTLLSHVDRYVSLEENWVERVKWDCANLENYCASINDFQTFSDLQEKANALLERVRNELFLPYHDRVYDYCAMLKDLIEDYLKRLMGLSEKNLLQQMFQEVSSLLQKADHLGPEILSEAFMKEVDACFQGKGMEWIVNIRLLSAALPHFLALKPEATVEEQIQALKKDTEALQKYLEDIEALLKPSGIAYYRDCLERIKKALKETGIEGIKEAKQDLINLHQDIYKQYGKVADQAVIAQLNEVLKDLEMLRTQAEIEPTEKGAFPERTKLKIALQELVNPMLDPCGSYICILYIALYMERIGVVFPNIPFLLDSEAFRTPKEQLEKARQLTKGSPSPADLKKLREKDTLSS